MEISCKVYIYCVCQANLKTCFIKLISNVNMLKCIILWPLFVGGYSQMALNSSRGITYPNSCLRPTIKSCAVTCTTFIFYRLGSWCFKELSLLDSFWPENPPDARRAKCDLMLYSVQILHTYICTWVKQNYSHECLQDWGLSDNWMQLDSNVHLLKYS